MSAPHKGFTLIELLIVISLIAILSSIGLVMYSGVQKQARISRRVQDLKAIQAALEVYYQTNKNYPTTNDSWRSECSSWGSFSSDQVIPGLVPGFILSFPADLSMNKTASTACYRYRSTNGTDYKLQDYAIPSTEMSTADFQSQNSLIDPALDGGSDCSKVDGATNITAWAIYSSNTGQANSTTNPACWN